MKISVNLKLVFVFDDRLLKKENQRMRLLSGLVNKYKWGLNVLKIECYCSAIAITLVLRYTQ